MRLSRYRKLKRGIKEKPVIKKAIHERGDIMENIMTMKEYLSFIEQKLGNDFVSFYPKLNAYYQELKAACLEIHQNNKDDLFESLKEVLFLDAQLQILLEYHKLSRSNFGEVSSEEELIEQIKRDSRSFYRELVGLKTSSEIPVGIMYLGDRI